MAALQGQVLGVHNHVTRKGSGLRFAMLSDAANHTSTIGYSDSFSVDGTTVSNPAVNTMAYPTTLTDADGFQSTVRYRYDFGARTRLQGPPSQDQPNGAIQTFAYGSAGRISQVTTQNNSAYVRYDYGPDHVLTYATVNNVADDSYSVQHFDGLGRVYAAASLHSGSAGGYKAQLAYYDVMGRAFQQSNPTEIRSDWLPWGDDVYNAQTDTGGWRFTQQTYDWKGRPLRTTNTDGTYKDASYAGCGCAGGEVVTLTDEVGRQQKVYSDVLGRQWKSEVLNWDGSVYATTTNSLNARDQATVIRQYAGTDQSTTYQDTTMGFDGYGRLTSKHVPEQRDANNNPSYTTYVYNNDDTIQSVTDARGASATYGYNNRHLVTGITYSAPQGSNIPATHDVSFSYDAAGNRTSMTDGLGSQSYDYDSLSRMTSETRTFNGVGSFTLSYDYNLAGELKKITDATGMTINYGFDSTGRLSSVTGSDNLYAGVSNYASNFQYRAWGGMKAMTDGTNHVSSVIYSAKMQPSQFDISGSVVHQNYDYYNDGRISFVHNTTDNNFDRSYTYDHAGRLTYAASGGAARQDVGAAPYYENFGYDAFANSTSRYTESWLQDDFYDVASYSNKRRNGWGYDSDGRIKTIDTRQYDYDAAGNQTTLNGQIWGGIDYGYYSTSVTTGADGDDRKIKEVSTSPFSNVTTYELRSTVLNGAIIEELNATGQKQTGYVYTPSGELVARQSGSVIWKSSTPVGTGQYETYASGFAHRNEFDPVGADVPLTAPPPYGRSSDDGELSNHSGTPEDSRFSNLANPAAGCVDLDGIEMPCSPDSSLNKGQGSLSWNYFYLQKQALIGYRNKGVRWGTSFDARYDANGHLQTLNWGKFNSDLSEVMYGTITALYETVSISWGAPIPPSSYHWLQTPQIYPDEKGIRANIAKSMQDENCATFIKDLLNRVATPDNPVVAGGDLLKIFDLVMSQRGLSRGAPTGAGGGPTGFIGQGYAGIAFGSSRMGPWSPDAYAAVLLQGDSDVAVHELVHLGLLNGVDDRALARALFPTLEDIPFPTSGTDAEKRSWVLHWSNIWDTELRKHCKRAPLGIPGMHVGPG